MKDKMKRTVAAVAALAALALGGAAIAGATGGGSNNSPAPVSKDAPALDNHADGETSDGPRNEASGENVVNDGPGHHDEKSSSKDTPENGESANDADGSQHAESAETN